jgi:hypothetical protein
MEQARTSRPCYEQGPCDFKYIDPVIGMAYGNGICVKYSPKIIKTLPKNRKQLEKWWLKYDDNEW